VRAATTAGTTRACGGNGHGSTTLRSTRSLRAVVALERVRVAQIASRADRLKRGTAIGSIQAQETGEGGVHLRRGGGAATACSLDTGNPG
jgi:hypothetical protein